MRDLEAVHERAGLPSRSVHEKIVFGKEMQQVPHNWDTTQYETVTHVCGAHMAHTSVNGSQESII